MSAKHVLILAAEGNETEGFASYLRERGFRTEVASDETEALEAFRLGRHDIVVVDIDLPGLLFDDFLEAVLKTRSETRIIVVTASESPSVLLHVVERGVSCYARRPFDREWLSVQMERL